MKRQGEKRSADDGLAGKIAITLAEAATIAGIGMKKMSDMVNLTGRGRNPGRKIESYIDPITGERMVSAAAVREYLAAKERRAADASLIDPATDAKIGRKVAREMEEYIAGPSVYSLEAFCEMAGVSPNFVRTGLHMGRIPGMISGEGIFVSGPYARWLEDQRKRAKKQAAEATAGQKVPEEDDGGPAWVPIEEVAERLGVRVDVFRLGVSRGGLEVKRINGAPSVSGPAWRAWLRNNPRPREDA